MVLKFWHLAKKVRNTLNILKCDAGEGWGRSVRPIVWKNEEVFYKVKEERHILYAIKRRKAKWIGHRLRRNCLLRYVNEEKIEGKRRPERNFSCSWKSLRRQRNTENWKKSYYVVLCGEFALEEPIACRDTD
jgi:hypothetical protein